MREDPRYRSGGIDPVTPEETVAFTHGMRIQRIAVGMPIRELWEAAQKAGYPFSLGGFSHLEYTPVGPNAFRRYPYLVDVITRKLGVARTMLIAIGQHEIDTFGCRYCENGHRYAGCPHMQ